MSTWTEAFLWFETLFRAMGVYNGFEPQIASSACVWSVLDENIWSISVITCSIIYYKLQVYILFYFLNTHTYMCIFSLHCLKAHLGLPYNLNVCQGVIDTLWWVEWAASNKETILWQHVFTFAQTRGFCVWFAQLA